MAFNPTYVTPSVGIGRWLDRIANLCTVGFLGQRLGGRGTNDRKIMPPMKNHSFLGIFGLYAATLLLFALPKFALAQSQTVAVAFNYQAGGTTPSAQTFSVTYPACCLLSGQLNGGANWLNASLEGIPVGQSSHAFLIANPAALRISVSPVGLAAGTYMDTVHLFTASVQLSFSYDVVVTLTVSGVAPQYADSVYFGYKIGGGVPAPQTVTFPSQPGREATGITARADQGWILVSLTSTSTPTVLSIGVNPVNMAAGSYFGTVVIGNSTSAWSYSVYLTITAPIILTALPPSLLFSAVQGGNNPPSQSFQVTASVGNAAVGQQGSDLPNVSWLTTDYFGVGAAPFTMRVYINITNLAPGTYTATLKYYTLLDNTAVTVPITLTVTAPPPVLRTSTNGLQFQHLVGSATPGTQSVLLTSSGSVLTAAVSLSAPWLTANVLNGSTPFTINVGVNPNGMAAGTYKGQVVVTTTGVFTSPSTQTIDVSLTIAPDERPVLTSVVNAASFKQVIGPGTWVSVMGSNLAKTVMQAGSLPLPVMLNGVSVELRGVGGVYNMLINYVSPTQINAFVPQTLPVSFFDTSCVVAVTVPTGATSITSNCQGLAPALFSYGAQQYASATHSNGAIVGVIAGTIPAKAGEVVTLWGTGFGQTAPPVSNVNGVFDPQVLASPVSVYVGGQLVQVLWAGMVGTGLYQFNIQLPDNTAIGDNPVSIKIAGTETERVFLPVR